MSLWVSPDLPGYRGSGWHRRSPAVGGSHEQRCWPCGHLRDKSSPASTQSPRAGHLRLRSECHPDASSHSPFLGLGPLGDIADGDPVLCHQPDPTFCSRRHHTETEQGTETPGLYLRLWTHTFPGPKPRLNLSPEGGAQATWSEPSPSPARRGLDEQMDTERSAGVQRSGPHGTKQGARTLRVFCPRRNWMLSWGPRRWAEASLL